ncbi:MAG TPA: hypothetical protein PKY05_15925, partial [Fibrobacteria bacterium]|nr:hypothetical protein [Fibrobacteria bacterium]
TLMQYEPKGQAHLRCGADSLCDRFTWKNGAIVKSTHGERRLADGTFSTPLTTREYTVNAQKRRTHTWRVTPQGRVLVEKRQLDNWGNVWKTWVNPDTSNLDSTRWVVVQSATYDGRLRKVSESVAGTNGVMQTTNFSYDVLGNPTGRQDAHGIWQRLKVDPFGNLVERRDTLGRVWRDSVNERGLPLMEVDPVGRKVFHTWNHLGRETMRIGWNRDTTLWIWKHDRLLKHRTPEGRWTTFGYDTMGRLLRAVSKVGDSALVPDANDLVRSWTYDKAGFRVSESVAGRKTHGWLVDGAGKLLADTNALGQVTRTMYDNLGRPIATLSPFGDTLTIAYDARGVLSLGRIGRDTLMQSRSDNLGRPVWLRRPGEGSATSVFTASGFLQSVQDSMGRNFGFRQDAFGQDSMVTNNGVGASRQAQRDVVGRLVKLVDEKNQITTFAWDSLDRLKSVSSPSGLVTTYAYVDSANGWTRRTTSRTASGVTKSESHLWDRDGLLRAFVDGRGIRAEYIWDSLARMTGIAYKKPGGSSAGSSKVFRYTPEGWTRSTAYGIASDSLTYDALGRNLKSIQKVGTSTYTVEHRYDDARRIDTVVYPDGSKLARRLDARGRVVSLWRNGVRLDTLVWQGARRASATLGNGIAVTYGYDAIGRMTSLKYAKGTTSLLDFAFAFTTAGKLQSQSRNHAISRNESYSWTPDGQLATANRGGYAYQSWATEATGNVSSITTSSVAQARTYNGFGELTGVGTSSLTYDLSGNLTNDGSRNLFWTPDGRLDSVGGAQKFVYDALGRLVRRTLVSGESTELVYDGWCEVLSNSSAGEKVVRVWGEYLDEEVVEFRTKGTTTTTRYLLAGN